MMDSLFFAGFDPLHELPELCTICSLRPPVFTYDYRACERQEKPRKATGFCCPACAIRLLQRLGKAESREWAEEEAALAEDDFDISEFHKHRLATFPERQGT